MNVNAEREWVPTFCCPHCGHVFQQSLTCEEDDESESIIGPCPKCQESLDFDDLDWVEDNEIAYYLAPIVTCSCGCVMELPYSGLVQTDREGRRLLGDGDPPVLPSEEWSAIYGCKSCGLVTEFSRWEIQLVAVPKWKEGLYQSGKGVFFARFPCGNKGCDTLAEIHVDIASGTAKKVLDLLRLGGFRWNLPCGHEMKTMPEKFYDVRPVLRRLW